MSGLEEQLQQILSDPGQMAEIQRLASSLLGGGESPAAPPPSFDPGKLGALLGGASGGEDDKAALLRAMRPWLSEKRRAKLDRALQLAKMARVARLAMAQMGEDVDV